MTRLSWVDPATADLVQLDVPEPVADQIARRRTRSVARTRPDTHTRR